MKLRMCYCRPAATEGHSGAVTPKIFGPSKICCAQKNLFWQFWQKTLSPPKIYFAPKH